VAVEDLSKAELVAQEEAVVTSVAAVVVVPLVDVVLPSLPLHEAILAAENVAGIAIALVSTKTSKTTSGTMPVYHHLLILVTVYHESEPCTLSGFSISAAVFNDTCENRPKSEKSFSSIKRAFFGVRHFIACVGDCV
jgi:hypothetical protein